MVMVADVLPGWPSTDGVVEVEYIGEARLCAPAIMITAVAYGVAYAVDVAVDEVLYRVSRGPGSVSTVGTIVLPETTIEIHIVTAIVDGDADSGFGVIVNGEAIDWHEYHDDALGDVSSAMILAISNHIE